MTDSDIVNTDEQGKTNASHGESYTQKGQHQHFLPSLSSSGRNIRPPIPFSFDSSHTASDNTNDTQQSMSSQESLTQDIITFPPVKRIGEVFEDVNDSLLKTQQEEEAKLLSRVRARRSGQTSPEESPTIYDQGFIDPDTTPPSSITTSHSSQDSYQTRVSSIGPSSQSQAGNTPSLPMAPPAPRHGRHHDELFSSPDSPAKSSSSSEENNATDPVRRKDPELSAELEEPELPVQSSHDLNTLDDDADNGEPESEDVGDAPGGSNTSPSGSAGSSDASSSDDESESDSERVRIKSIAQIKKFLASPSATSINLGTCSSSASDRLGATMIKVRKCIKSNQFFFSFLFVY